jgi:hypothetical protein
MRPSVPLWHRLYLRPLPHQHGSLEAGSTSGALLIPLRLEGDLTSQWRLELFCFRPYVARPHIFVASSDGRFNVDSIHRPSSTSAAERLNAFRQPAGAPSAANRIAIGKNEVLMGVVVVLVGVLLLGFLVFQPDKNQTVIGTIESASEITPTSAPQLLEGEAFVALAVEPGQYPPQLKVGDVVQIAVTPGIDGNGETRLLPEDAVVTDVSTASDTQMETVITVRAPQTVLVDIAASGSLHISKISGVMQ